MYMYMMLQGAASDADYSSRVDKIASLEADMVKAYVIWELAGVKHHAVTAVRAQRAIIATAKDFFDYGANGPLTKNPDPNKCSHFVRKFIWVPAE